jgi:hypothetical protein
MYAANLSFQIPVILYLEVLSHIIVKETQHTSFENQTRTNKSREETRPVLRLENIFLG